MTTTPAWKRPSSWDTLPALEEEPTGPARRPGRFTDFVLFALLPMASLQASGLPVPELAMIGVVLLAALRPRRVHAPIWLVLLLPALMGMMVLSAELNHLTPYRRLLHIGLYVALALAAAQGRFHAGAMARGLATGIVVSAAAHFAGVVEGGYEGRLTGLMADPNAAGYMVTTLGCLVMAGLSASRFRVAIGLTLVVIVILTYSRTSLLAVALISVWMLVGRRFSMGLGGLLLAAMTYAVSSIPISLQTFGPFADRSGSDALRDRILASAEVQVSQAPWYGNGPGTSRVEVQGDPFFFHNSYLSLQNEGGRIAEVLLLTAGLCTLVGLLRMRTELRNPWYEAGLIAVAVCAVNLGEVLLELPAALVMGMAAAHLRSSGTDVVPPPPRVDLGMVPATPVTDRRTGA